jgi:hypothetical protein
MARPVTTGSGKIQLPLASDYCLLLLSAYRAPPRISLMS